MICKSILTSEAQISQKMKVVIVKTTLYRDANSTQGSCTVIMRKKQNSNELITDHAFKYYLLNEISHQFFTKIQQMAIQSKR